MRNRRVYLVTWCVTLFCLPAALYCVWLLVRMFLYDQFVIPSNSMRPTLIPGDRVVVNKTKLGARLYSNFDFNSEGVDLKSWRTRGYEKIEYNDIIVFNFPLHEGKYSFVINHVYCKRVVALPGDTIRIKNGHYMCNNYHGVLGNENMQGVLESIPDSILYPVWSTIPFDDEHFRWNVKSFGPLYIPRLGDSIHLSAYEGCIYKNILEWETGKQISWNWESNQTYADEDLLNYYTFMHNYYFVAGDNVVDSFDSRYWGLVPEEYIIGVVCCISYSCGKSYRDFLWDRILKDI